MYEYGLLKKVTAANGVETEYDYDKNGRLTHLNHSNTEGAIKEYDFTYDMAGNIIQKNQDVFKYDKENRLTQAFLKGSFAVDMKDEIQNIGAVHEDLFGKKQLNYNLEEVVEDTSIIELDYNGRSIGLDLEDQYEVTKIELKALTIPNRVVPEEVRVFTSLTNFPNSYSEAEIGKAEYIEKDGEQILSIILVDKVSARFVKVKTDHNERDIETFASVNEAEFKNSPEKIIKVYYNTGTRTEEYTYDDMGNRMTAVVTSKHTKNQTYRYYPNTNRLMTNGTWLYRYDANGNVVEKGDTVLVSGIAICAFPH